MLLVRGYAARRKTISARAGPDVALTCCANVRHSAGRVSRVDAQDLLVFDCASDRDEAERSSCMGMGARLHTAAALLHQTADSCRVLY
jgi:predicted fused transcriptional regulator/phosphomethylpyrimidine kinase